MFFPIAVAYVVGNIQALLNLFLTFVIISLILKKNHNAGVCSAIVTLVKPHVALLFIWAIFRRDWNFCKSFIVTIFLASAASLITFGWKLHMAYLKLMLYLSGRGESFAASHSIESTIYRILHRGNNLNWDGTHTSLQPSSAVHLVASVLGLGLTVALILRIRSQPGINRALDFGLVWAATTIASPVAYEHHFGLAFVLIPLALLVVIEKRPSEPILLGTLLASYLLLGQNFAFTYRFAGTSLALFQSTRLAGDLLLICGLVVLIRKSFSLRPPCPRKAVTQP